MKSIKLSALLFLSLFLTMTSLQAYATSEQAKTQSVATVNGKININTADANLLASTLKGVGLKRAHAIVEYRQSFGPFHDIQELADVSGIGQSTIEKNAHLIGVK